MQSKLQFFRSGPVILLPSIVWEYFSLYSIEAILVIYLTQKLNFTDVKAFQLFASFMALTYVSPILGGWIADKFLGYRYSVYVGSLLLIAGHISIILPVHNSLYIGLSLIICGIGFSKSNIVCLMGRYYKDEPEKIASSMLLYYLVLSFGCMLATLVSGYLAKYFGFNIALTAASFGVFSGLVVFLLGRKRFGGYSDPIITKKELKTKLLSAIPLMIITITGLVYILRDDMTIYAIIIASLFFVFNIYKNRQLFNKRRTRRMLGVLVLILLMTLLTVFILQTGSAVNLFILRNVNKLGIPTMVLRSTSSLAIIIVGLIIVAFVKATHSTCFSKRFFKVLIGFVLLAIGYIAIAYAAKLATITGYSPVWLSILFLAMIGLSEALTDPVALSAINHETPVPILSSVTALYYLIDGAFANFIAGKVATLSAVPTNLAKSVSAISSAKIYLHSFSELAYIVVGITLLLAVVGFRVVNIRKPFLSASFS